MKIDGEDISYMNSKTKVTTGDKTKKHFAPGLL